MGGRAIGNFAFLDDGGGGGGECFHGRIDLSKTLCLQTADAFCLHWPLLLQLINEHVRDSRGYQLKRLLRNLYLSFGGV